MTPQATASRLTETFGDLAIKVVEEIIATRPKRSPLTDDCVHSMNYWKQVGKNLIISTKPQK